MHEYQIKNFELCNVYVVIYHILIHILFQSLAREGRLGMEEYQLMKRSQFKTNREQRTHDLAIHFQKQIQQNEEVQTHPSIQGNQVKTCEWINNSFCILT